MTFHIVTLFPNAFDSYLKESILKRALEDGKIAVKFYNPRDFADNAYKRIDRAPYGGGPGMVIQAEPVIRAVEKAILSSPRMRVRREYMERRKTFSARFRESEKVDSPCNGSRLDSRLRGNDTTVLNSKPKIIWLSPSGKQFTNEYAKKTAQKFSDIIIICGRYEGIDARVKKAFKVEEVSVGPFVLTGGEVPAMVMIDCISRQVAGVLGCAESLEEERIASPDVYTRPEVFEYKGKKLRVPKVLLSGNHKKIDAWRGKKKHREMQ